MAGLKLDDGSRKGHLRGTALVLIATLAWSFSGLFTRLITADLPATIAWRSLFGSVFLLLPFLIQHRGQALSRLFAIGWPGWLAVLIQVVCQAATVGGLVLTTVANVTVIYATAPFFAAALAWWWLGERVERRTLVAATLALLGVLIVVSGSIGSGHLIGDGVAVVMTVTFAVLIVIPRRWRALDMQAVTIISSFLTFLIFVPFADTAALDTANWLLIAGFGFNNMVLALFLFLAGSRLISAAQSGLIATLEIVLAPLWVWLYFGEVPSNWALVGGGLIVATILWHIGGSLRRRPAPLAGAPLGETVTP